MKHYITIALCIFLSQMCTAQVMMLFSQDSLTGIVSPLDVDSLFYWFAADVGVTDSLGGAIATDEGVGTWNDLSGNGHHVTQSTNGARPVWKATGGPGSKPCIQFDGTNDFLLSASDHWWGSDDIAAFVVVKFANATLGAGETLIAREGTATTRQFLWYGNASPYQSVIRAYQANTPSVLNFERQSPINWKHTNWKVHTWTNDGTGSVSTLHSDGASVSLSTTAVTGNGSIDDISQKFQIGANRYPTVLGVLNGSISEIIVYSRALTATERAAIENYLNRKYDLYYLIILGFPLASARRRKLIPNEKKNAA